MATLIVEDGSGVTDANTYIDVAFANQYCQDLDYTSWAMLAGSAKTMAILRGMSYIESLNWKGQKADEDYSLEWPRSQVTDRNGFNLDSDYIPPNLKKALAEAAYRESGEAGSTQPDLDGPSNIQSMKAGSLALSYFGSKTESGKVYSIIEGLLKGLLLDGAKVRRT